LSVREYDDPTFSSNPIYGVRLDSSILCIGHHPKCPTQWRSFEKKTFPPLQFGHFGLYGKGKKNAHVTSSIKRQQEKKKTNKKSLLVFLIGSTLIKRLQMKHY
jgi:hypothetical protein